MLQFQIFQRIVRLNRTISKQNSKTTVLFDVKLIPAPVLVLKPVLSTTPLQVGDHLNSTPHTRNSMTASYDASVQTDTRGLARSDAPLLF